MITTSLNFKCDTIYEFMVLNNLRKPQNPEHADETYDLYKVGGNLEFKTKFTLVDRPAWLYLVDDGQVLTIKMFTLNSFDEELGINAKVMRGQLDYLRFIETINSCLKELVNHHTF